MNDNEYWIFFVCIHNNCLKKLFLPGLSARFIFLVCLPGLSGCFIKSVHNADKKNRAKKHELRTKNPENQRNGEIKRSHAQRKMVRPHVEVFFCHAVDMGFVFMPGFCAKHKGNMRVKPE